MLLWVSGGWIDCTLSSWSELEVWKLISSEYNSHSFCWQTTVCPPWEDLGKLLFDLGVSCGSTSHLFNREMHCYVCQCVSSKHTILATVDLEFPLVSILRRMKQIWLSELPLRVGFILHFDLSGTECLKSSSERAVDSFWCLDCDTPWQEAV